MAEYAPKVGISEQFLTNVSFGQKGENCVKVRPGEHFSPLKRTLRSQNSGSPGKFPSNMAAAHDW